MSEGIKLEVRGIEKLLGATKGLPERYARAVAAAIFKEGQELATESTEQVPIDTSRLIQTAFVAPLEGPGIFSTIVGYGTKYAIYVHERLDLRHTIGKARFLFDPWMRRTSGYLDRIAKTALMKIKTGGGVGSVFQNHPTSPQDPGELKTHWSTEKKAETQKRRDRRSKQRAKRRI